jgi:hypothetical protein
MYFQVFVQFSPLSLLSSYLPKWDCTSKHMIHTLPRKQRKPSPGKCPVCQIPTNSTKETLNQMQIHAIPSILKLHAASSIKCHQVHHRSSFSLLRLHKLISSQVQGSVPAQIAAHSSHPYASSTHSPQPPHPAPSSPNPRPHPRHPYNPPPHSC